MKREPHENAYTYRLTGACEFTRMGNIRGTIARYRVNEKLLFVSCVRATPSFSLIESINRDLALFTLDEKCLKRTKNDSDFCLLRECALVSRYCYFAERAHGFTYFATPSGNFRFIQKQNRVANLQSYLYIYIVKVTLISSYMYNFILYILYNFILFFIIVIALPVC